MDIVTLVQQNAPKDTVIDEEFLDKLYSMPPKTLASQQSRLDFNFEQLNVRKNELSTEHVDSFVKARQNIDRLELLTKRLDLCVKEAQEQSLSTPKVPERSFKAITSILHNDVIVFENVNKIQELLFLPELLRDKILDGEFQQALELAQMTRKLKMRYFKSQLISKLNADVEASIDGMRFMLLKSLKESTKLSVLTKAVSFLKEMSTENLENVFLDSRFTFFLNVFHSIPSQLKQTQPFAYLKRLVDVYREHVFGTINGFRVIFKHQTLDSDSEVPLARFARKACRLLLTELSIHTPKITNESDRASLFLQLAFCSKSMGRVGGDFWRLLNDDIMTQTEWETALKSQEDSARRASKY